MKKEKINELTEMYKLTSPKSLTEAGEILPKVSLSKFVGAVNIDIVLNLKESQKKETVRGSLNLPHSTGEEKKVVVLCEEKDEKAAIAAGAVEAGLDTLIEKLNKGFSDFDVVVATPEVMPKIVRLGKVLGPKGLMPNPKTGTVTTDVAGTVKSYKAGKLDFKMMQDQGVIRSKTAKVDMQPSQISDNVLAFIKAVYAEVKRLNANPFKRITLSPTMGPGIKLDVNDIMSKL